MVSPEVVFLIFSTGKIVCARAKREDISEAVKKLRRRLEEDGFIMEEI